MKNRRHFKFILISLLFLSAQALALNTRDIDVVRKKGVLNDSDKEVISSFLQEAVDELFYTQDLSSMSKTRQAFVSRKSNSNENSAVQYQQYFESAAYDVLRDAIQRAANQQGPTADNIMINLLLIVNELESTQFLPLVIDRFDSNSPGVGYLAVNAFTDEEVLEKLNSNSSENFELINNAVSKLSEIIDNQMSPSFTLAVIEFCAGVQNEPVRDLLLQIADKRISQYENWAVSSESVDYELLTVLGLKAQNTSGSQAKNELMAKMSQLYSYAVQRYALGQEILNGKQKGELVDVIVGLEAGVISDMLGGNVQNFKKAIEKNDTEALISAHDELLGSQDTQGTLAQAVNFSYTQNDGQAVVAPEKLPQPTGN